jgi:hypothetical protein
MGQHASTTITVLDRGARPLRNRTKGSAVTEESNHQSDSRVTEAILVLEPSSLLSVYSVRCKKAGEFR